MASKPLLYVISLQLLELVLICSIVLAYQVAATEKHLSALALPLGMPNVARASSANCGQVDVFVFQKAKTSAVGGSIGSDQ